MNASPKTATVLLVVALLTASGCAAPDRSTAEAPRADRDGDCGPGISDAIVEGRRLMDAEVPYGPAVFRGSAEVCGIEEIEVFVRRDPAPPRVASDVFFTPTVLVGEPGQQVDLLLTHDGKSKTHTFTLDELGIDEPLFSSEGHEIGTQTRVRVEFPTDGEPLLFYCRFHRFGGMWGALVTP